LERDAAGGENAQDCDDFHFAPLGFFADRVLFPSMRATGKPVARVKMINPDD
jgi:hypothetical protein